MPTNSVEYMSILYTEVDKSTAVCKNYLMLYRNLKAIIVYTITLSLSMF
jgi:hypothetical protein